MVAFIQGTWLYLSGIQADKAQLAIFDSVVNIISSQSPSCSAMPDTQLSTKKWGKVNRAALAKLVHDGDVDINDLSTAHIDAVGKEHFRHRDKKNFCHNFRDFAATFDLEAKYSGARKRAGKTMRF